MFDVFSNKTTHFLYNHLYSSVDATETQKNYCFDHSLRVTHIGLQLTKQEHANKKVVFLGCLLHDVGKFDTSVNGEYGRLSSKISRDFLKTLPLSDEEINDICFSIWL